MYTSTEMIEMLNKQLSMKVPKGAKLSKHEIFYNPIVYKQRQRLIGIIGYIEYLFEDKEEKVSSETQCDITNFLGTIEDFKKEIEEWNLF